MSYQGKVEKQRERCRATTLADRVRRLEASAAGLMATVQKPQEYIPVERFLDGWICRECQQPLFDRRGISDTLAYPLLRGLPIGIVPHTKASCLGLAATARTSH
jgi:hypothetical protein